MPENMRDWGHVVNAKSLFGDQDFWAHMSGHYPDLFARFVDWIESRPRDMVQHGTYATARVDPVALIKQHFADAFQIIHEARPDFDSNNTRPIRLAKDRSS
jgi:hypothetical protein